MDRLVSGCVAIFFWKSVPCALLLTPIICFLRSIFLVGMDMSNSRRELMLRKLFFTWMVYAFYPMLILSFFFLVDK
jgi:hypothetical protein